MAMLHRLARQAIRHKPSIIRPTLALSHLRNQLFPQQHHNLRMYSNNPFDTQFEERKDKLTKESNDILDLVQESKEKIQKNEEQSAKLFRAVVNIQVIQSRGNAKRLEAIERGTRKVKKAKNDMKSDFGNVEKDEKDAKEEATEILLEVLRGMN